MNTYPGLCNNGCNQNTYVSLHKYSSLVEKHKNQLIVTLWFQIQMFFQSCLIINFLSMKMCFARLRKKLHISTGFLFPARRQLLWTIILPPNYSLFIILGYPEHLASAALMISLPKLTNAYVESVYLQTFFRHYMKTYMCMQLSLLNWQTSICMTRTCMELN